jgi:hypothetical protein
MHKGLFDSLDGSDWQPADQGAAPAPSGAPDGGDIVAVGDLGLIQGGIQSGGSGTATVTTTATAPSPTLVTTAGSGLEFNLVWDSSVASAPAGFMTDVVAAAQYYESMITTTAVVNLDVGYDEIGGSSLSSGALGESETNLTSISYATLVSDLKAHASTDSTDASFLASLPASAPVSGNFWLTTAQAKALGVISATSTSVDASIGFGVSSEFTFGDTNSSGTVAAGTYDFFATVTHEMSETMGRLLLVGESIGGGAGYSVFDLAHYSAAGTRDFTQSTAGYFSVNGGTTNLGTFNTVSGGDAGDWASASTGQANPVLDDSFDAYATPGALEPVSANDLATLDAIGWTLSSTAPLPSGGSSGGTTPPVTAPAAPTGVAIASVATSSLSTLAGTGGMVGSKTVATFTEVGGVAGDKFSYTLGGAGASDFTISSAGVLSTVKNGVSGSTNGKAVELTVTANDVTTSATSSSPAQAVNFVVGGSSADTINISSMSGIVAAAPTFIFGSGGNDKIVGTGMTGTLYFEGGAGADSMTGGSGTNYYEYGATTESTPSAMDIITNFNVSVDRIDMTGISSKFTSVVALAANATSIAAGTIDWVVSGGNTFVYANNTTKSETLSAATMKVELQGSLALTSANFLHN